MNPTIPSYLDKEFIIDDNLALIRNPKKIHSFLKYKKGDTIPSNRAVGMNKLIPLNTKIKVTDVKIDTFRNVYIHAVPVEADAVEHSGWTRATNIDGSFMNEILHYVPNEWDLPPLGDNFTVTDKLALIRNGKPTYRSKGRDQIVPNGAYVEVTARSRDTSPEGKYVRVRHMTIEDGQMVAGEPIGWTAASNLTDGNSTIFNSKEWKNIKGDNAAWKKGKYIGSKVLVGIVGTGGQLQHITIATLEPYIQLMKAACKDNILLSITSGFRVYAKQKALFDGWKKGEKGFNRAAAPGRSNHQNGIAFDLNTGGFDGAPVYDWMKKNATSHGFIRTVNKEHWHWEYHPELAAEFKKTGKFKLDRVKK